jgi:hypothetical protein
MITTSCCSALLLEQWLRGQHHRGRPIPRREISCCEVENANPAMKILIIGGGPAGLARVASQQLGR